jgi:hypothetical protein
MQPRAENKLSNLIVNLYSFRARGCAPCAHFPTSSLASQLTGEYLLPIFSRIPSQSLLLDDRSRNSAHFDAFAHKKRNTIHLLIKLRAFILQFSNIFSLQVRC